MPKMFTAEDLDVMQRVRAAFDPAQAVQPGEDLSDAAAVRRSARSLSPASGRAGRAGGTVLSRELQTADFRVQIEALSRYGVVHDPVAMDAIDGVRPRAIVEPESAEALAELLALCSRERMSIVLRGRGTKLGWGRRGGRIDLVASTARLNRVLAHAHGDLTATVEAGATVGDLNRELARHGQWLPLDTAFEAATVGGTIATNESGPLRHRHGTPRDLLIGIHLATTDGRLVKAGGNVVKNVAGYDLGKLVSGSFGSLAAIVSATFKLAPLPAASTTLVAAFRDRQALAQAVWAVSASQLEPTAFDVHVGRRA